MRATWDFSSSNSYILAFTVIILVAFIFTPWLGLQITDNGARILSDNMYGAPGAKPGELIWIIPVIMLIGIGLGIWGVLQPERNPIISIIGGGIGLISLVYFITTLASPVLTALDIKPGVGFWISLTCCVALILQVGLASPPFHRESVQKTVRRKGFKVPRNLVPYLFLIPALALYFVWIIAPTFYSIYLSLTNWDGVSNPTFVGFANYERLFTADDAFKESLVNNLRWLIVFITVPTTMGLAMALLFNQEMRGGRFFKVSFYSPLVLSLPVIGLIWGWIYNPRIGLVNSALTLFGMPADALPGWLGDREIAIWCVIAAAVWRQVGYVMVLYLAGLKNIDPTLMEAGRIDGASRWNLFRHIIFPLLSPVTTIIVVISVIDSLRAFDLVSIMTRGGQNTQVLANFMYMEAFNNYRMGYGAAIAVVLFFISLVFILFYLWRVAKDEPVY